MSRTWPTEEEWARWRLEQASARAELYRGAPIDWTKVNLITADVLRDRQGGLVDSIFMGHVDLLERIRTFPARLAAEHGPDWREVLQEQRRRMKAYIEHDQDHQLTWGE